jgi:hypothetical protein
MNSINSVCTTVSQGKVYVTANNKYVGELNHYNNFFTKFFAWLFGSSVSVDFDGKVRSINKASYVKLLSDLKVDNQTINKIGSHSKFKSIIQAAHLPATDQKMRNVIASSDRTALFKKLAIAISEGDVEKALLMIDKGASLEQTYYQTYRTGSTDRPAFHHDDAHYSGFMRHCQFTVFCGTPILQAAKKDLKKVYEHLKDMGANLSAQASEYEYTRTITSVTNNCIEYNNHRSDPNFFRLSNLFVSQSSLPA